MFQLDDDNPLPFSEALDSRAVKTLLPTNLRTRAMEQLAPEVRERAFWSAGVTHAGFLQEADDGIEDALNGKIDRATFRQRMDGLRAQLGAPEAREVGKDGGLTDLWSEKRQNVLFDTNVQMARGYGQWMQAQDPDVLDQWPALELIRVAQRKVPRDWLSRWRAAGGKFYQGRMIALVNDPVWVKISRFGLPYAPFDFGSGMGTQPVDRAEAEDLGVLGPDDVVAPQSRGFNDDFQMTPEVRSASLLNALANLFKPSGLQLADGVFTASDEADDDADATIPPDKHAPPNRN
jgi:hypothetical protein